MSTDAKRKIVLVQMEMDEEVEGYTVLLAGKARSAVGPLPEYRWTGPLYLNGLRANEPWHQYRYAQRLFDHLVQNITVPCTVIVCIENWVGNLETVDVLHPSDYRWNLSAGVEACAEV